MDLTNGTRATATTAAATVMAGGLTTVLYGIIRGDLARSIGGLCLTTTALTVIALLLIRRWVTNTGQERVLLAASQREAQAERGRYFAAQAALEGEQGRLVRDMAAERAGIAARLKAERGVLEAEFEERRAALIAETMEATVLMITEGKLAPPARTESKVIQLRQHQQRQPERERARERGGVAP